MTEHFAQHHEIAIVSAGMASLTCARELQAAGRDVGVIDKSRGLGGRLATRRLAQTQADHGVCYLKPKGERFTELIQELSQRNVVRVWTDRLHTLSQGKLSLDSNATPRYVAAQGATAIAKDLAQGLPLYLNQQICDIQPIEQGWQLTSQNSAFVMTAKIVIFAIPAPQALPLVQPILQSLDNHDLMRQLQGVQFAPCLTAIATYTPEITLKMITEISENQRYGITCLDDSMLGWIGFESTKQIDPVQGSMIIQSNAKFATAQFDADNLIDIAQQLCDRAAQVLDTSWIAKPDLVQLHRWKYAFVLNPIDAPFLQASTSNPLYFIGDWCGGDRVEHAFLSGLAMAEEVNLQN